MDLKELLLLKKLSFGIISLTGSLVVLLGLVLYANVWSANPYANVAAQPEVASNRAPASLPAMSATAANVEAIPVAERLKSETRTFDIDCNGHLAAGTKTTVVVEQIRIRRSNCGDDLAKSQIVNASNGYVATLFQTNPEQISSDYIHLTEGENRIKVHFQDRLGSSHTSEILFARSLAP